MKKTSVLTAFDYFLIIGIILLNVIYSVLSDEGLSIIGSITSITGVLCVVLVAKGSIWNYLFGLINVSLFAYVSYQASLYGLATLNAVYYIPMQFIGWWQWRKRGAAATSQEVSEGKSETVRARRMTWKQRIILLLVSVIFIGILAYVLVRLPNVLGGAENPQPIKDATITVLSILAQALMAMAFLEQWALWIVVNLLSVITWSILAFNGEPNAALMVAMWAFYLINSINGMRVWLKLSK